MNEKTGLNLNQDIVYCRSNKTGEVFIFNDETELQIQSNLDDDFINYFKQLDQTNNLNREVLLAALSCDKAKIDSLFSKKKSIDMLPCLNRIFDDQTLLHKIFFFEIDTDLLSQLISYSGGVNTINSYGQTLLHISVNQNNLSKVDLLLSYGADVMIKDNYDRIPLYYASRLGYEECVQMLLTQTEDQLNTVDSIGLRPIDVACNYKIYKMISLSLSSHMSNQSLIEISNHKPNQIYQRTIFNKTLRYNSHTDNIKSLLFKTTSIRRKIEMEIDDRYPRKISVESFEIQNFLGRGSFGEVYKVGLRRSSIFHGQNIYALKMIKKELIRKQKIIKYLMSERNVLAKLDNIYCAKLYFAFQSKKMLYLVMEYCGDKDLSYFLAGERFSEQKIRQVAAQLIVAIEYLHSFNIVYRDLKPENIVVTKDSFIKLIDFGLAKAIPNTLTKSFCGSLAYLAPEIIKRNGYGKSVDWYMLGVLLYEMTHGNPPFLSSNSREALIFNILNSSLMTKPGLNPDLEDLIRKLLVKDPTIRLGSGFMESLEIKCHGFFKGIVWDDITRRSFTPEKFVFPESVAIGDISKDLKEEISKGDNGKIEDEEFALWNYNVS